MRPLSYPYSTVFSLIFSVINPSSYEHIISKWVPEIRAHCPYTAIILVGTKIDLRDDPTMIKKLREKKLKPLQYSDGVNLAKDIGAVAYIETSSKTGYGIDKLCDLMLSVSLYHGSGKKVNVDSQKEKCLTQ